MGGWVTVLALGLGLAAADLRAERFTLRFGENLGLPEIRLAGPRDSRRVAFASEADWKPGPGSALHLFLEHSPELDADRSFLCVTLNGGILRSLRLDGTNQDRTELVVPLPPVMLHRRNDLVVSVEQAPTRAEQTETAWTAVSSQSYISVEYERKPAALALRDLPAPLLDPLSYRPQRLCVLLPHRASPATLEAIGILVADLVSRIAPERVTLSTARFPAEATDPLVVVGTASEQPALRELLESSRGSRAAGARTAGLLSASHGRSRPVLYVTASSPEGVASAARNLLDAARRMDGAAALVPETARPRGLDRREWRGFAPPRSRFALSDLGYGQDRLTLAAEAPLEILVRVPPDARFMSDGQVALVLSLLPEMHGDRDARLDVEWNGVALESFPARRLRSPTLAASVRIPRSLLWPENRLALSWKSALPAAGRAPLASLAPASELYLPRDYSVRLPDLALLRASFYPFSLRADLSDVIVVVPDGPSEDAVPVLCQLASLLGRVAPSDRLRFRVRPASALSARERSSAHLLVLETGDQRPLVEGPALDWRGMPGGVAWRDLPMIQELVSPWNKERFVLRFRASSSLTLLQALRRLGEPDVLSRLAGDTAFLRTEGPACYLVGTQRTFEEVSYLRRSEAWLQTNWLALPVIVAVVSGTLFLALHLALGHYKEARAGGFSRAGR